MKDTKNLMKRLKRGIETAHGDNGDFVYITIGEAKKILELLEEEQKKEEQDGK